MLPTAKNVETKSLVVRKMCGPHRVRHSRRIRVPSNQSANPSGRFAGANMPAGVMCFECGKLNPQGSKFCIACGSTIRICPISMQPFQLGDKYAKCIHCGTYFHLDHLKDWLDGSCPVCKNTLEVELGKLEPPRNHHSIKKAEDLYR